MNEEEQKENNDVEMVDFATTPEFIGSVLLAVDNDIYSLKEKDGEFEGYKITYEAPIMRHFTVELEKA